MSTEQLLQVELVERVFEGSPRWLERAPYRDIRGYGIEENRFFGEVTLQREMMFAWGNRAEPTYDMHSGVPYSDLAERRLRRFFSEVTAVHTCVNPNCPGRTQEVFVPDIQSMRRHHALDFGCDSCGHEMVLRMFRPIENKWVYIFEGDPEENVQLTQEIYVASATDWRVCEPSGADGPRNERPMDRSSTETLGKRLAVTPGTHYQFFLSTIQLSEGAISFLKEVARAKPVEAPTGAEQLVNTTVGRTFLARSSLRDQSRERKYDHELVPVADPFAMAEEVNEWDFRPALSALYTFRLNENLQAKLGIAGTLRSLIVGSDDRFDLVDELEKTAAKLSAWNGARGWIDRYEEHGKMLAEATDEACQRLIAWVDSDAHGIVELACQQETHTPGTGFPVRSSLAFALVHYASVFMEILGTPAGAAFIARLHATTAKTVDAPSAQRERRDDYMPGLTERPLLPTEYVLLPANENRREIDRVPGNLRGVLASLLAVFAPIVIRADTGEFHEAAAFADYFRAVGIDAHPEGETDARKPMGYQDLRVQADSIRITEPALDRLGDIYLPERTTHSYATKIADGIGRLFGGRTEMFTSIFSLWTGVSIYANDGAAKTSIDRIARTAGQVQYPFKLLGFAVAQGRSGLAWWAKSQYGIDLAAVAAGKTTAVSSEGLRRLFSGDIDRFARNVKVFSVLGKAGRILTGPIAILFGGVDLIVQLDATIEGWQNGDYAMGTGSYLLAVGAATGIIAWLVPGLEIPGINILIAALVILGALVVLFWAKNDLELFASHCFLGDRYGYGSTNGPRWADGEGYRTWDNGSDRYLRQYGYLLNLLCGFKVALQYTDPWAVRIQPGYIPPGSFAEVTVVSHFQDSDNQPVDRSSTALVDMETGEYVVTGDELDSFEISPNYTKYKYVRQKSARRHDPYAHYWAGARYTKRPAGPRAKWGSKEFDTFTVRLKHERSGLRVRPIGDTDRDTPANWTARVRFHVFTGVGSDPTDMYLPVPGGNRQVEVSAAKAVHVPYVQSVFKRSTQV